MSAAETTITYLPQFINAYDSRECVLFVHNIMLTVYIIVVKLANNYVPMYHH